jgi:thioredoxin reductase
MFFFVSQLSKLFVANNRSRNRIIGFIIAWWSSFAFMLRIPSISSLRMARVAVIGGGPGGIIAAKELNDQGIKPVIFESSSSIGGIWSSINHKTWKSLHTNLSKYTCAFSTTPWPSSTPMFPSQNEVNKYLNNFVDKWIDRDQFKFNCQVQSVKRSTNGGFTIHWKETVSNCETAEEFDQVIIASGFLNTPDYVNKIPVKNPNFRVLGSHEYFDPKDFQGQNVLVVGGSFSGMEIAAELTKSAKNVFHVFPKHTYVVPKFLPDEMSSASTTFHPLDFSFYTLRDDRLEQLKKLFYSPKEEAESSSSSPSSDSLPSSIAFETVFKSNAETGGAHSYFQKLLSSPLTSYPSIYGGKESRFLNLPYPKEEIVKEIKKTKPTIAISDEYHHSILNSKNLHLVLGKLQEIDGNDIIFGNEWKERFSFDELVQNNLSSLGEEGMKIDSCIICTGYRPNLSFLDAELRKQLQHSEKDSFMSLILYKDMFHYDIPGLYFVGMYKGPYFGIMELQAVIVLLFVFHGKIFLLPFLFFSF